MKFRVKALVGVVVAGAGGSLYLVRGEPGIEWTHFFVYLAAIVLSSGMKVGLPKREATMGVNFPFILLGIVQLSPLQTIALAVASVIAQCRIRVIKSFSPVQIVFNVANVTTATALAWVAYGEALKLLHGEIGPSLAVAAAAYFFANTIPLAVVLGWESDTAVMKQWIQGFPWYFPFYLVGAVLAATANFIGIRYGWLTSMLLIPMVYTLYRAYGAQMSMIHDRERHIEEMQALHLRTIEGLAMAIEAKDRNTHRHLMRVRIYVAELGKRIGLDPSQMKALETAALLHDIGKLAVPEHIINKPGKLSPAEFDKMKVHTVVGADILERVRFPYPVVPIVRSHHEAWDGSGYPDGLKGEEIPIGARILSTVDCFDALASDRPYRKAMPLDEAMAMVKAKAGIQFDPAIVGLLEEHYLELESLANLQIEEIAPLETDLLIERGAAPRAGFQAEAATEDGDKNGSAAVNGGRMTDRAAQEAAALAELEHLLDASLEPREASSIVCRRLQAIMPFDCFAVYLKCGGSILPVYVDGRFVQLLSSQPIPIAEGLSGWVAENRRPIVNGNPTVEPNLLNESAAFTSNSSALSIPLFDSGREVIGVLTLYSSKPAAFSKGHLHILEAIEPRLARCMQNALFLSGGENRSAVSRPEGMSRL